MKIINILFQKIQETKGVPLPARFTFQTLTNLVYDHQLNIAVLVAAPKTLFFIVVLTCSDATK